MFLSHFLASFGGLLENKKTSGPGCRCDKAGCRAGGCVCKFILY